MFVAYQMQRLMMCYVLDFPHRLFDTFFCCDSNWLSD